MRTIKPFAPNTRDAADLRSEIAQRVVIAMHPGVAAELGPCWTFSGAWQDGKGFKKMKWRNRTLYVHRAHWAAHHGEIPEGLILDHKCRNRGCCRPEHLEPVTVKENTERGNGKWIFNQGYTPRGECNDHSRRDGNADRLGQPSDLRQSPWQGGDGQGRPAPRQDLRRLR